MAAAARNHSDDLLVDCGNAESAQSTLKDFLHTDGVNRLPQLILTTGEVRNSGGAVALDQIFGIGKLWTSQVDFHSSRYHETVAAFEHPTARHCLAKRGDNIGDWSVLFPDADTAVSGSRADDNALVLIGTIHHTRILLLSDLGRAGQDRLLSLATTNELRADVVVSGLPANGEPLCEELISAIQPRAIIIADSEFPAQRRASPALRARLDNPLPCHAR